MKAEQGELQRSYGEIRLFPESLDDLWHLSHLVGPGDLVFATTLRSVETPSDRIRPEKPEKRPVRLGIRVEKVEFHKFAMRLRIHGVIEQGPETGSHHTLNVEPGYEISVIKRWRQVDLERIDRAVRASVFDAVHILTIEEGDAELFRIRQFGPEGVLSVSAGSGKESGMDSRQDFFERVASHLSVLTGPVVIAGPGFVKDDFMKFLRGILPGIAGRCLVVETRRIGPGAVQEVIGQGILEKIHEDLQLGNEVRNMNELLGRIGKGLPVAYGRAEVQRAIDYGACERLLVLDSLLRDEGIVHLIDRAELINAGIVVFSSEFEPGRQLDGLGGIAALLRYAVG
ncbi:MAG: mRNA surveillance protein pelota [Methanomicrobiales archaeon]|nr:mRNA surveillance protein pelota [Methanomicrobiales archaeon]NYT20809.1 mRNA surveillance protein pelota [Methanomicrobiales archaeon]